MSNRNLRRGLLPALLASAALVVPAAASAAAPCADANLVPTTANAAAVSEATLCLLNAERTRRGLRALRANDQLRRAAQTHSTQMVRGHFFNHVSPTGATPTSRVRRGTAYLRGARRYSLGENIAWGSCEFATPAATVERWMDSSGHRSIILNRRFRHVGVGIAIGAPEGGGDDLQAATYTTKFGYRAAS